MATWTTLKNEGTTTPKSMNNEWGVFQGELNQELSNINNKYDTDLAGVHEKLLLSEVYSYNYDEYYTDGDIYNLFYTASSTSIRNFRKSVVKTSNGEWLFVYNTGIVYKIDKNNGAVALNMANLSNSSYTYYLGTYVDDNDNPYSCFLIRTGSTSSTYKWELRRINHNNNSSTSVNIKDGSGISCSFYSIINGIIYMTIGNSTIGWNGVDSEVTYDTVTIDGDECSYSSYHSNRNFNIAIYGNTTYFDMYKATSEIDGSNNVTITITKILNDTTSTPSKIVTCGFYNNNAVFINGAYDGNKLMLYPLGESFPKTKVIPFIHTDDISKPSNRIVFFNNCFISPTNNAGGCQNTGVIFKQLS